VTTTCVSRSTKKIFSWKRFYRAISGYRNTRVSYDNVSIDERLLKGWNQNFHSINKRNTAHSHFVLFFHPPSHRSFATKSICGDSRVLGRGNTKATVSDTNLCLGWCYNSLLTISIVSSTGTTRSTQSLCPTPSGAYRRYVPRKKYRQQEQPRPKTK
jgi:hypothetical protein